MWFRNSPTSLSPQDQQKIQLAISLRRINSVDIPESAKVKISSSGPSIEPNPAPSTKKRKADEHVLQPEISRPSGTRVMSQQAKAKLPEEAAEEDVRDELYCTLVTSVVGIQYYKGLIAYSGYVFILTFPKVWRGPVKRLPWSESHKIHTIGLRDLIQLIWY